MGNVPSRWGARAISLAVALVVAYAAWVAGAFLAGRWAHGFQLDWFAHAAPSLRVSDAAIAAGVAGGLAALLAILLVAAPTAAITRWRIARNRYQPAPVQAPPMATDEHAGRLAIVLGPLLGALAALGAAVDLALLHATRIGPNDYTFLVAGASALAAGLAAGAVAWLTFAGLVRGTLVVDPTTNALGRGASVLARHRKPALALVLALSVLAGYSAMQVSTDARAIDALPRGDPTLAAATNLSQKLHGGFTQQVTLHFHVIDPSSPTQLALYQRDSAQRSPGRATDAHPENITDEVYMRAIDDAVRFFLKQPAFVDAVGENDLPKLVNWTLAGGDAAPAGSYALPDTSPNGEVRYRAAQEGMTRETPVYRALQDVTSPSWRQTVVLLQGNASMSPRELGAAALAARDAYLHEAQTNPGFAKVFGPQNAPIFSVDEPLADAHDATLAQRDLTLLLPIAAIFLAVVIVIALRDPRAILATLVTVALAALWTLGVVGAAGIALTPLHVAALAVVLACGAAFALHVVNEHEEQRRLGRTRAQAWALAGRGSMMATLIAGLASAASLALIAFSPSLLVAQLGVALAVAVLASAVAALVVPPMLLSFGEADRTPDFRPSRMMTRFGEGIGRARWFALGAVALVLGAGLVMAAAPRSSEGFAVAPRGWVPTDALRVEHERAIGGFYDTDALDLKAHALLFEGDMTDPASHAYVQAVTRALGAAATNGTSRIVNDSLRDMPSVVETYIALHRGVNGSVADAAFADLPGALAASDPTGQTQKYPATQAEMRAALDGLMRSPLAPTARLMLSPSYDAAVTIVPIRTADADAASREIDAVLASQNATRPANMTVRLVGAIPAETATASASARSYLGYAWDDLGLALGVAIAVALVAVASRGWRAPLAVLLALGAAALAWRAVLATSSIPRSPGMAPALAGLILIGTLVAAHFASRARDGLGGAGKAALHAFIGALGVALVFTQMADAMGRRGMVAASVAIGLAFLLAAVAGPALSSARRR